MAQKENKAGLLKRIFLVFLVIGPASLLVLFSSRSCEHKFKELDDMGTLSSYSFTGIDGKKYTDKSFKGQVVLFSTIQPTCPDSCSVSLWFLDRSIYQNIQKNKKKLGHVKIVSFVTDGYGKSVNNLKDMDFILNDQVVNYDPKIWILAKGDPKQVYNISRNGNNLLQKGDKYFGGEAFQELLLLADKENHLRMVLEGNEEGMVRQMFQHMALLDKQYDKEADRKKHPKR
jgi:hypothetical protein